MNNKGFAITTILYGTLILFLMLLVSMLGILSTYKDRLSLLIDNNNGARDIINKKISVESSYELIEITDGNGNVPAYAYYNPELDEYKNSSSCTDDKDDTYCFDTDESLAKARGIKTLKAYNGKIFMGLGDWDNNSGPVEVIYYDTSQDILGTSSTIIDEAIENFNIIDNKLYTTGVDPRSSWGYGSYYVYNDESNDWSSHQFYDGWIHVFDIEKFDNKLFMVGSTVTTETIESGEGGVSESTPANTSTIKYSSDNGVTFENVEVYHNDELLPYNASLRFYNLLTYNGKLYAWCFFSGDDYKYSGIYEYDGVKFVHIEKTTVDGNVSETYPNLIHYTRNYGFQESWRKNYINFNSLTFNGKFIYVSGVLYISDNMRDFSRIDIGREISNMIVVDNKLYLLTYTYSETNNNFNTRIFSTTDLVDFDMVYEFTTETLPYSFEFYDDAFYVGTVYHDGINVSKSGSLYKIYQS